ADAAAEAIRGGRDADTSALLRAAARVQETNSAPATAQAGYRARVGKALQAQVAAAARGVDRDTAMRLAEQARLAGLPNASVQQLRAQAERIPDLQGRDPGNLEGMVVLTGAARPLAAFAKPV